MVQGWSSQSSHLLGHSLTHLFQHFHLVLKPKPLLFPPIPVTESGRGIQAPALLEAVPTQPSSHSQSLLAALHTEQPDSLHLPRHPPFTPKTPLQSSAHATPLSQNPKTSFHSSVWDLLHYPQNCPLHMHIHTYLKYHNWLETDLAIL